MARLIVNNQKNTSLVKKIDILMKKKKSLKELV